MTTAPIPFIDLAEQRRRIEPELRVAIDRVLDHCGFVNGPEIEELEAALRQFGYADAIACSSGTDALVLALMALGVGPGDRVLVPAFTFAATASAVALVGATPVFVDVRLDTYNIDPDDVHAVVADLCAASTPPAGLIAVDLFGQPAELQRLRMAMAPCGGWLIVDAAQSLGATAPSTDGTGDVLCTSFFPSKPLGAYGDGGAVLTDDPRLAATMRSLRTHGQGETAYEHVRLGLNARMDTMQAAILLVKLGIFPDELRARQAIAARYLEELDGVVSTPTVLEGRTSTWAQFTVRVADRSAVRAALAEVGVPTAVHYPLPLGDQPAFRDLGERGGRTPNAALLASEVLSLPLHPYLAPADQTRVIAALRAAVDRS